MKARSEDDILARTPLSVKLGDKEYAIPILAVTPTRAWRKKLFADLAPILESFNFQGGMSGTSVGHGLTAALVKYPETLTALVFDYRNYGHLWYSLIEEGVPDELLEAKFLSRISEGNIPEAPDFSHAGIIARATEEQLTSAFAAIQAVVFPFLPQLGMATQLLRSSATSTSTLQ